VITISITNPSVVFSARPSAVYVPCLAKQHCVKFPSIQNQLLLLVTPSPFFLSNVFVPQSYYKLDADHKAWIIRQK